jgi:hypothetical protein
MSEKWKKLLIPIDETAAKLQPSSHIKPEGETL